MKATMEIPLRIQDLALVAWATTDDGRVIGPVGPGSATFEAGAGAFIMTIYFPFERMDRDTTLVETRVQLGISPRHPVLRNETIREGDRWTLVYALHCDPSDS